MQAQDGQVDAKTTGAREDLRVDLAQEDGVADGVEKLFETTAAIRSGQIDGLDPNKSILPLLVTLDYLPLANGPYVRSIIDEILRGKAAAGKSWSACDYQICAVFEFEDLVRLSIARGESIAPSLLRHKMEHPQHRSWGVAEWVREVWPEGVAAPLPSHQAVIDEGFERLAHRFARPDLTGYVNPGCGPEAPQQVR